MFGRGLVYFGSVWKRFGKSSRRLSVSGLLNDLLRENIKSVKNVKLVGNNFLHVTVKSLS